MKVLLIIPPNYPLIPKKEIDEFEEKPNNHFPPPSFSIPYYLFFSNNLNFIFIDYSLSVSKVSKTFDNALLEITKHKVEALLFDRVLFENSEDYKQNVYNLVSKIKNKYPRIKIGFIVNSQTLETCDFVVTLKNGNLIFPKEIASTPITNTNQKLLQVTDYYRKKNTQPSIIINTTIQKIFIEILKKEFYNFNIVDSVFDIKTITELKKIKSDYFDFEFQFITNCKSLLEQNIEELKLLGLQEVNCKINSKDLPLITQNIEKLHFINQNTKLHLKILPNNDNKQLFELITLFDQQQINYTIQRTEPKIENKKDFGFFSYVYLLQALDKENTNTTIKTIKDRIKQEIPLLKENITFEQTLDFCINSEKRYLEFYLDIIHFLDGFFTKNEIIEYLTTLHPNTTKEKIELIVGNCINSLEKEMFIDYLNSEDQKLKINLEKSHYISSLPRIENLFLLYNGCEKGYIFSQEFKQLEEIPKDIFFFFVFSKGIYFLKDISSKLQLIFKDKLEYSKENALKTTEKLYLRLKQYKLCK